MMDLTLRDVWYQIWRGAIWTIAVYLSASIFDMPFSWKIYWIALFASIADRILWGDYKK